MHEKQNYGMIKWIMQNIGLITQIMQNMPIPEPCRKHGIWTFYRINSKIKLLAYNVEFMLLAPGKNVKEQKIRRNWPFWSKRVTDFAYFPIS